MSHNYLKVLMYNDNINQIERSGCHALFSLYRTIFSPIITEYS